MGTRILRSLAFAALSLTPFAAGAQGPSSQTISVCVMTRTGLREVAATYHASTGDTTLKLTTGLVRFRAQYTDNTWYAANHYWFINSEPLKVGGRQYVKYGLPRVLGVSDIDSLSAIGTVTVFKEAGASAVAPEVIYLPVRRGCEFQPYQMNN